MVRIDGRSSQPIYEQIINQMKQNVIAGYLKPGDMIPSVRRLALDLSITPGTVAKAYQELERQHVIETLRGKGTFITAGASPLLAEQKKEEAVSKVRDGVRQLKELGVADGEIRSLLNSLI